MAEPRDHVVLVGRAQTQATSRRDRRVGKPGRAGRTQQRPTRSDTGGYTSRISDWAVASVSGFKERAIRSSMRAGIIRAAVTAAAALAASGAVPSPPSSAGELPPVRRAAVGPVAFAPPKAISRLAQPPAPPRRYRLPRGAIWVSNAAQLRRALSRYVSRDIVLRNGFYGGAEPFPNRGGDRLWAQTLGGAVFGAGISMGGNSGPGGGLIRGVAFDVEDDASTLKSGIIAVWGTGVNTRIQDVTLEGNGVIGAGILARQVEGLVVQRVVARHFRNWGVLVDKNDHAAQVSRPPLVEDIDAAYVTRPVPLSSNGTAEACVWIGNTAVVRRVRAHDCAWEGLWAGTAADDAVFEDIRVTNIAIGVYLEHFVHSSTFRRLQIGPNVDTGLKCEWADPGWNALPACVGNVVEQSLFDTRFVGVYLDAGTTATTVRTSTFVHQCWAGIGNHQGVDNLYDTSGNDYRGLPPGTVPISTQHYSAIPCFRS